MDITLAKLCHQKHIPVLWKEKPYQIVSFTSWWDGEWNVSAVLFDNNATYQVRILELEKES